MGTAYALMLDDDLDIPIANLVLDRGPARVIQSCRIALGIGLGEWMLDEEYGIDWLAEITRKPIDTSRIEFAIRSTIEAVEGVQAVTLVQADVVDRSITIDIEVLIDGEPASLTLTGSSSREPNAQPYRALFWVPGLVGG